jgi:phospholipid/cholesterol/gamma-HCH transport system substrate-binding protein
VVHVKSASSFAIGIFVIFGLFIGLAAIVWLGGGFRYLETASLYVTYFDESVQDLKVDSSVTYRGLDVGSVERLNVAPDGKLIEVVMSVSHPELITKDTLAQLDVSALSGKTNVNLIPGKPGQTNLSPSLSFKPKYTLVPSCPSEYKEIFSGAEELIAKMRQIDFSGIARRIEEAATSVKSSLDAITKEVQAMKLAETAGDARELVEDLDARARAIAVTVNATAKNLQQASETLNMLMERIYAQPSDIFFSRPLPQHRQGGR